MIPASFLQEVLARTDLAQVVGRHVELRKAGINLKGLCPFHGEKTPSFIVSPSRQTYHCFGCGVHGDAIRFLTEHVGMGFRDAVTDLAQGAGLRIPDDDDTPAQRAQAEAARSAQHSLHEVTARAADYYRAQLKDSSDAVAYLKRRGLTGAVAARFGLGWAPAGWRSLASVFAQYDDPLLVDAGLVVLASDDAGGGEQPQRRWDRFRERVMFPIRDLKGHTIGFGGRVLGSDEPKYLNSPETPLFTKGRELYGLYEARQAIRQAGMVLVTEGYMDVVALAQLGVEHAVATLGTACTSEHVHKLLRFTEHIVFSFDGDTAGRKAAARALQAVLPHASDTRQFRFLFLPPEHDPDSYIRSHGLAAFQAQVRAAVPLSEHLLALAAQDCDLAQGEGRARFAAQARSLWAALPAGALRLQLLADIAQRAQLALGDLKALWQVDASGNLPAVDDVGALEGRSAPRRRSRRTPLRMAPRTPADTAVQLLCGNPAWWLDLSSEEHELLHQLGGTHNEVLAWLERDLANHGARPWAVVKVALDADSALSPPARALADGDALFDATWADVRRTVDLLHERALAAAMSAVQAQAQTDPAARSLYRSQYEAWSAVKARLAISAASDAADTPPGG